ncbi:unnamed protein product [Sphacelaria rigidula]
MASDDPDRLGDATCNMDCSGDASETCGGRNAISVYEFTDSPSGYAGCFVDSGSDRVLTGQFLKNEPTMSLTTSTSPYVSHAVHVSRFVMTPYSQCFCGVNGDNFDRLGESSACTMNCAGDDSKICGGRSAISVYYGDSMPTTPTYLGCYEDESNSRIFTERIAVDAAAMTTELCEDACRGYAFFGTQYGQECWCGDASTDYDKNGVSEGCTFECPGNSADICGGRWAASVYEL